MRRLLTMSAAKWDLKKAVKMEMWRLHKLKTINTVMLPPAENKLYFKTAW